MGLPCVESHHEWACPRNQWFENNEGPRGPESIHVVEEFDYIYNIQQRTYPITSDQMKQVKERSVDTTRLASMSIFNSMDEESKDKLQKQNLLQ